MSGGRSVTETLKRISRIPVEIIEGRRLIDALAIKEEIAGAERDQAQTSPALQSIALLEVADVNGWRYIEADLVHAIMDSALWQTVPARADDEENEAAEPSEADIIRVAQALRRNLPELGFQNAMHVGRDLLRTMNAGRSDDRATDEACARVDESLGVPEPVGGAESRKTGRENPLHRLMRLRRRS